MLNEAVFEMPPPGALLNTVTLAVPLLATSEARMLMVTGWMKYSSGASNAVPAHG